jgi:hypothetical protein
LKDFGTIVLDINETHRDTWETERDVTQDKENILKNKRCGAATREEKRTLVNTVVVIEDMGRVPKRLKTEDKPIVAAVKVKVESDDDNKEDKKNHWTMTTMRKK